ncbi:hypothetical protein SCP_1000160 [Sparassis crispa]|uniref:F-box domain-containing protein n=1 Tax=Sparassis crispa TaxID=139825 RepID=A0A401GY96_9APHY|nr:hypothetical protein SCP_1000160 [Sparassis crispa]GBE86774.1 hypothetical protein SCP_1000160 [Sparassis crispa]
MTQCCRIINIDKQQFLGDNFYGPLGRWLFSNSVDRPLTELFAIPFDTPITRVLEDFPIVERMRVNALGKLDKFPNEVLAMIFDCFDSVPDAICLGLVNGYFLALGRKRIHALIIARSAPWSGDRIICLGKRSREDHFPAGMLSEHEKHMLGMLKLQDDSPAACAADSDDDSNSDWPGLYDYAMEHFEEIFPNTNTQKTKDMSLLMRNLPAPYSAQSMSEPDYVDGAQPSTVWALCNLSKREYVRGDKTAQLTHSATKGPCTDGSVGLGHVLVTRICWSSDSRVGLQYNGDLHQGPWAGDRIVITTLDRMPIGHWTDISKEALKLVEAVWDAEFANFKHPDWRKLNW